MFAIYWHGFFLQLRKIGPIDLVVCSPPDRDLEVMFDEDEEGLSKSFYKYIAAY